MNALAEVFDAYGRNARLYPAILVAAPLLVWPRLLTGFEKLSSYVAATVLSIAILYGLSHIVRSLGRKAERRLIREWGGLPTTQCLLWQDGTLDATTKARYHAFLRGKGLAMPTPDEEHRDLTGARERLTSAVTWLRNNRRGEGHRILHGENAAYGFRRNLYGAKSLGIAVAVLSIVLNGWAVALGISQPPTVTLGDILYAIDFQAGMGLAAGFTALFLWMHLVTPKWVRESADLYAKALLETCDTEAA